MNGNAIIGQSGGPTSVINASLVGIIKAALQSNLIENVYGMRYGIEGFMQDMLVDLGRQAPGCLERLRITPSSALGSCRHKVKDDDFPKIMAQLQKYNIRYFFSDRRQ